MDERFRVDGSNPHAPGLRFAEGLSGYKRRRPVLARLIALVGLVVLLALPVLGLLRFAGTV